jgi:hypothetical protein
LNIRQVVCTFQDIEGNNVPDIRRSIAMENLALTISATAFSTGALIVFIYWIAGLIADYFEEK